MPKDKKKSVAKKKVVVEKPKEEKIILTDKQVMAKVKEISKLEMPLHINKELRELADTCEYNLQSLQQQLNHAKKASKESSVTLDTDDTLDIDVTDDTDEVIKRCVSSVSYIKPLLHVIFEDSVLEQICKNLYLSNKALTFGELAIKIGKSENHIRNTISKNKVYFRIFKPNGKISVTHVTHQLVDEIDARINRIKQVEEEKAKAEAGLKLAELQQQTFNKDIISFVHSTKPKRDGKFIQLDFKSILEYSPELANQFLDNPEKFLGEMSKQYDDKLDIQLLNIPHDYSLNIEQIREENLNKIISIEGRVTSFGEVKPIITEVKFECPSCGNLIKVFQNYRTGDLTEPSRCSCGRNGGLRPVEKKKVNSCFIQLEDLQDKTDNPHSKRIKCVLFNGLCEEDRIKIFTPGNEVQCLGILKEVPIFKNRKKTVFLNWILEIMSAELIDKDVDLDEITEEELESITKLSNSINEKGMECVVESFAPDIHGYAQIKEAMILQLCGQRNDRKKNSIRNKSNILLIGDPGIAKSVLGDFALKVSGGSRKAVGGGSSAVGITASVMKEEDSLGGYRVEPGAMILAKDLLFLDEMNNLSEDDKPKLQEGMNEQTISINKANIHVQMKVTSGILAAANPIHGHFKDDPKLSVQEQFNIPSPILNRFDSIFVMRDEVNEEKDKAIAKKMIQRQRGNLESTYNIPFLKKFFAYVKHFPEPKIDNETQDLFEEVYHKARKTFNQGVKINPRFLESLTRMSIASAKIRQSEKIELKDINVALRILSQTQYKISETMIIQTEKVI